MTISGYTVQDAANKIGISYKALLKRIERGTVKSKRASSAAQSMHVIPVEEVDRLKKTINRRSTRTTDKA